MKKTIVMVIVMGLLFSMSIAKDDEAVDNIDIKKPYDEKIQQIHDADKVAMQAILVKREQLTLALKAELIKDKSDMQVVSQILDQLNDLKNELWKIKKNQIIEIMKIVPTNQRLRFLIIELRDNSNDLLYKNNASKRTEPVNKTNDDGK